MRAPRRTVGRAKALRRSLTMPEVVLWTALRRSGLEGRRFRRQHPIGPFVLDFYCTEARLAVEVDGSAHDGRAAATRDAERDAWLRDQGIRTLRLLASDVLRGDGAEHVLPTIAAWREEA